MCTATRLTIIGRQRLTRRELRQVRLWCAIVIIASPFAGLALAPVDTEAAIAISVSMAVLPGLLLLITHLGPREIWRVSEIGISHARTHPIRRRIRLGWDDITRLTIGEERIGMRGRGKRVIMLRRFFAKDDWELTRDLVRACLSDAFDLDTPTPWDIECERSRGLSVIGHIMHWVRIAALAVGIFASIVVGGFLLLQINAHLAFYGSHGIIFAWAGFGAWIAWREERSRWRRRIAQ